MVPLEELARHDGFEVDFKSAGDQGPEHGHAVSVTLADLQGYDVIVGQRFNHHSGLQVWRRARTPSSRLVYETDDDVYTITPENWAAYHLFGREDVRDAVTHSAEVADLITVTVPHLADVMREQTGNPNVAVLPNSVPGWVLDMRRPLRAFPAVGWQGGASHGSDVGIIAEPVRRFLKRFPGWQLKLNGTDYRPTFRAGDRARFSGWIPVFEDARGYFSTLDFDIGLAPLHVTEFSRSKSNVKVLECAALGIPSIATDCDVYSSFIRHGENGFLVRRDHEWLSYMSELANDSDLRRKMGAQAREDARAWTIEQTWTQWRDTYTSLFRSHRV